ncbi:winged helix family two component transcriptional regulator [Fictibacillus macauensis ZFHKF-1]|uniref:Winged helix family two component transcriptional regulator n=1 Tax=Fictibacillus macauensis ZFHKF-1 TaxID=1196324 RepID=I8UKD3_9BACL|nr:response regulator transcription factor [Fictibacillus macauensis]EIT87340.1 winged helix family two component transcriptional regulator [Fictibacillus macauensis ZFHKF-1]
MKIMLAEDDQRLSRLIVHMLEKEGFFVTLCEDGDCALNTAMSEPFDLLILDWMMPGRQGIDVSKELRKSDYQGPILMLTARGNVDDLVRGLSSGADDYLAKPFECKELIARIYALGRRRMHLYEEPSLVIGEWRLDRKEQRLLKADESVMLTGKEFQLLTLFARHKHQVLPRETILLHVWGADSEVTMNTVEAFVTKLRKKLDPLGKRKYIVTVRGIGYRMECD